MTLSKNFIVRKFYITERPGGGGGGGGGVRESNKVELIKSGGGRRGRSPLSPS